MHFFNPAPVQQFVEVDPHRDHRRRRLRGRQGARRAARQEAGHRRRQGGLHRQRPALRLPQPRGVDVREPLRHPRGPRRGHALRLRLPDGPARAARPDRPRHGLRDPRHDVQAGPRPAARARARSSSRWSAPGCSAARRGRGFYTYAAPGSPEVVADAQTPAGGPPPGSSLRPVASVGVVGSGTMATGIIEVFAKAGYDVTYVARGDDKVDGRARRDRPQHTRGPCEKGRMTAEDAEALLGRVTGATAREALADVDLVVEAIAEDLAVKQDLFRDLDRICKPRRHPRHDHLVAADHRLRQGRPTRPQDVIGHALLQPRPGHEAGRGRAHRVDRAGRHRHGAGPLRQGRQGGRRPAATARGSSSTRCSSRTSTTPCGCSRPTTPAPTTSTPR